PRGTSFTEFQALDLGAARLEAGDDEFALERTELATGGGSAFTAEIDVTDLPHAEGTDFIVRTDGSLEAPSFGVRVRAPATFEVDTIGHVTPGAGTLPIPRRAGLRVAWSPPSDESEMFIILATPTQGLVCRVRDEGEFTIPKKMMTELTPSRGQLVIERHNEALFDTAAAPDGGQRSGRGRYAVQRWYNFDLQ
ncbi:MAG: hypothetical protein ACOCVR_03595, partial [Myxococcota bacterium]